MSAQRPPASAAAPHEGEQQPQQSPRERAVREVQRQAVFHGAVCFVLGLLAGFPYTGVVLRDHAKEWAAGEQHSLASLGWLKRLAEHTPGTERAWKMAHLEGVLNGLCLMVVSAIVPVLSKLSRDELGHLGTAMAVTAYGNSVASILCALGDVRGMLAAGNLINRSANLGFGSGVPAIGYAVFLILKGSRP